MRFRAAAAADFIIRPVDDLSLVYHRRSGTTHVVGPDSVAILRLLQGGALSLDEVIAKLEAMHELEPSDGATIAESIAARLDEMAAMDLVDRIS